MFKKKVNYYLHLNIRLNRKSLNNVNDNLKISILVYPLNELM